MSKIAIFVFAFLCASIIDAKVTQDDIKHAKKMITRLSQLDNRCTTPSDCVTIPVGAQICDGPSDYIVYSKLSTYADSIQKLAPLTSKLEEEYHKENSVGSACATIGEPTTMCTRNLCTRTSFILAIVYPFGRA